MLDINQQHLLVVFEFDLGLFIFQYDPQMQITGVPKNGTLNISGYCSRVLNYLMFSLLLYNNFFDYILLLLPPPYLEEYLEEKEKMGL